MYTPILAKRNSKSTKGENLRPLATLSSQGLIDTKFIKLTIRKIFKASDRGELSASA